MAQIVYLCHENSFKPPILFRISFQVVIKDENAKNFILPKLTQLLNKWKFYCWVFHTILSLTVGLTLKASVTTAADDIYRYFFIVFQRK